MKKLIIIPFLFIALWVQGQTLVLGSVASQDLPANPCPALAILSGTVAAADASVATSRAITMPTGTAVGNLILIFMVCDGVDADPSTGDLVINTAVSGVNWNMENKTQYATGNMTSAILWKIAEGSDALTITSTSEKVAYIAYRLCGYASADPITVTNTAGVKSTDYNPPSNTTIHGALDYIWFVFASSQNNPAVVASAAPADFTNLQTQLATSVSQPSVSVANRTYNVDGAYDPGTFTAGDAWWLAFTVIVNPAH